MGSKQGIDGGAGCWGGGHAMGYAVAAHMLKAVICWYMIMCLVMVMLRLPPS